jgi:transcriptional regulator with PAS, ATPase and Fis domain
MKTTPMNEIIREDNGEKLIGESPAIQQVIQDIALLAPFDEVTVVLQGETGVGKDLVARLIHANSRRRHKPLVSVNGATIPDDLWEAECFGVKTGAFTGAQPRDGLFRQAHEGTLFLDELQDWPRRQHAQLKEFLQQRLIRRVGDDRPLQLDVRVIVASNVELDQMVAEKQMARDVRERLGHMVITIPPLRQRREDIPALVEYFLAHLSRRHRLSATGLTEEAQRVLREYDWPGNVRELQNVVAAAGIKSQGSTIEAAEIIRALRPWAGPGAPRDAQPHNGAPLRTLEEQGWKGLTEAQERAAMEQLLATSASLREAARQANLRLSTLQYKINKLGLEDMIPHHNRSDGRNTNLRSTK